MNSLLFVVGLGVLGVIIVAIAVKYRSSRPDDLGSVSHTWIAELRAGDPYDSSR